MGPTLCVSCQTSPKRFPKQNSDDHRHGGLTLFIVEFMKPRCLWRAKKKKKMVQLHQQEKQQQLLKNASQLTLEDWLLASPGLNNGGDFHAFKQFSNRIHPSLGEEEDLMRKSKSMEEREVEVGDFGRKGEVVEGSSLRRNQSGKTKKKVSFRLPEVADIIIIDSR